MGRVTARLRRRHGFSIVEAMIAMLVLSVAALALASTHAGAMFLNKRAADREQALDLIHRQIDRLRSLPYDEVGMLPANDPDAIAHDLPAGGVVDGTRLQSDWKDTFCGLPQCATNARWVIVPNNTTNPVPLSRPNDPRRGKITQRGTAAENNTTVRDHGIVLYTYIYWNDAVRRDYKLATITARFLDPQSGQTAAQAKNYASVTLTTVIADNPGQGQVP